jgi:hypothetical protein
MIDKPYDEYSGKVIKNLLTWQQVGYINRKVVFSESCVGNLSVRELRGLLADAWLAGLAYSLNLIEGEM